jgi:murein L,D-transpeptidase YafK
MAAALMVGLAPDAAAQRLLVRDFLPRAAEEPLGTPLGGAIGAPGLGGSSLGLFEPDFLSTQLRSDRVLAARVETRFATKQLFEERGLTFPAAEIFLRVLKRERVMELWARNQDSDEFTLVKTYGICALAGEPGPKRRQGDNQTPEGFYRIERFNPYSSYFLSLHIDYPNRSDRILGSGGSLGGDIFIHGGCVTEGCIAITDEGIKELYWLAVETRAAGQRSIPIHIFPFRMTKDDLAIAARHFGDRPDLIRFWQSLEPGYRYFEENRRLPGIVVASNGYYALGGSAPQEGPSRLLGRPVGAGSRD